MGAERGIFFFQAEDGIRNFCLSRGLGNVYKGQVNKFASNRTAIISTLVGVLTISFLYTSDAADELLCVDPGGRRIIKKKKKKH